MKHFCNVSDGKLEFKEKKIRKKYGLNENKITISLKIVLSFMLKEYMHRV